VTAQEIKDWYSSYDSSQGLDELLKYRQQLSLCMYELACEIAELEEKSKAKEAERKREHAFAELESDKSTASARTQHAVLQTRLLREDEAKYEGQLKGCRIKYEALNGISHSMASYLSRG
tara:strand:+ start:127 stop:486 length:360 start_codon:yes stop_codon:yes gene_type:complete